MNGILPGATHGTAVLHASDPVEVQTLLPLVVQVTVRVLVPPGVHDAEHALHAPNEFAAIHNTCTITVLNPITALCG